jgi:threonine/homoserine/homoserine lactone efflux protein
MVTFSQLLLVSGAALVFALVPGPAVVYIITRSVDQSRRAGMMSGAGVACGNFALAVAAAFGLSAILASSLVAYDSVRYLGAAYLVYLGVKRLLDRSVPTEPGPVPPERPGRIFRQGLFVGLFNPKAALFFLSFLPQFVDRGHGAITAQTLVLGAVVVAITLVSDCCYAMVAGGIARSLLRRPKAVRRQQIVAGGVYIGLGLTAAFTGSSGK